MGKARLRVAAALAGGALLLAGWLFQSFAGEGSAEPPLVAPRGQSLEAGLPPAAIPRGADLARAAGLVTVTEGGDSHGLEDVHSGSKTFVVDGNGKLVRNEHTRLSVVALTPPEQLRTVAQAQVQELPAAAAVEALDLVDRFNAYQSAQKLSFSPDKAPLVPEEALAELDGLHALRVSYFGGEGAQHLFGKEEAAARQLLEWMRQDSAPGLSMEQRAMRAQARYDTWLASQGAASAVR
jgi:hypothetical protein